MFYGRLGDIKDQIFERNYESRLKGLAHTPDEEKTMQGFIADIQRARQRKITHGISDSQVRKEIEEAYRSFKSQVNVVDRFDERIAAAAAATAASGEGHREPREESQDESREGHGAGTETGHASGTGHGAAATATATQRVTATTTTGRGTGGTGGTGRGAGGKGLEGM